MRVLGSDSMVIARSGPGLWVAAVGVFLPATVRPALLLAVIAALVIWATSASSVLAEDASFYVVACYRLRHGTLPLGWVALLA